MHGHLIVKNSYHLYEMLPKYVWSGPSLLVISYSRLHELHNLIGMQIENITAETSAA